MKAGDRCVRHHLGARQCVTLYTTAKPAWKSLFAPISRLQDIWDIKTGQVEKRMKERTILEHKLLKVRERINNFVPQIDVLVLVEIDGSTAEALPTLLSALGLS